MRPEGLFKIAMLTLGVAAVALLVRLQPQAPVNAEARRAQAPHGRPPAGPGSEAEIEDANYILGADLIDYLVDSGILFSQDPLEERLLERRKIVIATDINAVTSKKVIRALLLLNDLDPKAPIDLYIRTEGGWVSDAFGIVDVMRSIEAPVNTYALGGTHSAGMMLLAAGTGRRRCYPGSSIMFHAGMAEEDGVTGMNHLDNERLLTFWKQYTKLPREWMKIQEDTMYFFGPGDAVKYGVADEIVSVRRSSPTGN